MGRNNFPNSCVRLSLHPAGKNKGTCPKPPDKLLSSVTKALFSAYMKGFTCLYLTIKPLGQRQTPSVSLQKAKKAAKSQIVIDWRDAREDPPLKPPRAAFRTCSGLFIQ